MAARPSPETVPDSIDPVIGWRAWCIRWRGRDQPMLTSPMQPHEWWPREVARARCTRLCGAQHPHIACGCGFYAVSGLHRLPAVLPHVDIGVIGSVAMWGRVIEHSAGYRGELAYPDRIRLVCGACFRHGRDVAPTLLETGREDRVEPVCADHSGQGREERSQISAGQLEQMLLSTYAVDLLPAQALERVGFSPCPLVPVPGGLIPAARNEFRQLSRSPLGLVAVAALIAALLVVRLLGLFPARVAPPVSEAPVSVPEVVRSEDSDPRPSLDRSAVVVGRPSRFGVICGHLVGSAVERARCGAPSVELFGFYTSPPEPVRRCSSGDAYTRKPNFSVCWLGLGAEARSLPERLRLPGVHLWDL